VAIGPLEGIKEGKMSGSILFSLFAKMRSKQIEFPLKGIKSVALRPSVSPGEILYSLPLVKTLSNEYDLTVFLPETQGVEYFKMFPMKIMSYPESLTLLKVYRLREKLKELSFDLFIDLNRVGIDVFSFILNARVTASIYEGTSVNLVARSRSHSITDSYQYLMDLLGLPISWREDALGMKEWDGKNDKVGISTDIGVYPGFLEVVEPKDLYKVSSLIAKKGDISTIAFFLGVPQVLLVKRGDNFAPPSSLRVVRYSNSITGKIIERCL
jgi:hypothetical protein